MRVLYGKTKPFYIAPISQSVKVDVIVSNVCERRDMPDCIEGYVLTREDMRPIRNAKLVFTAARFHAIVLTDENGYYKLFARSNIRQLKCFVYADGYGKKYFYPFPLQNGRVNIFLSKSYLAHYFR